MGGGDGNSLREATMRTINAKTHGIGTETYKCALGYLFFIIINTDADRQWINGK